MKRTFEQLADAQSRKVHQSELATLRAQRDELLAALERMSGEFLAQICFSVEGGNSAKFHACLNQARAAIAKAKG